MKSIAFALKADDCVINSTAFVAESCVFWEISHVFTSMSCDFVIKSTVFVLKSFDLVTTSPVFILKTGVLESQKNKRVYLLKNNVKLGKIKR